MNKFKYEDLKIGHKEDFTTQVPKKYQDAFRSFTKDINPLHLDSNFAREKGYKDCVVFGMLTASYYSTLVGVYLPGEKSLIHSVEIKFLKPVYIGDILRVEGVVKEKSDTFKLLIIKATITNQNNVKVSRATMKVGVN